MSGSKIILNKKNNKSRLITLFILVLIAFGFLFSKLYLPDARPNKSNMEVGTRVTLANVTVEVDSFSINYEEQLGQIIFIEEVKNVDEKYKVNYVIGNENFELLQFSVIEGEYIQVKGQQHERYVILQYAIPSKFHYLNIGLEQVNIQDSVLRIDYRDIEESAIKEKGTDFMKEYQDILFNYLNFSIDDLVDEKELIEGQITYNSNLLESEESEEQVEILKSDIASMEEKLKGVDNSIKEKEKEYEEMEKELIDLRNK